MIAYFDTSAFVPLSIEEPASQAAQDLWDAADRVVSVRLIYPETRAAIAMAHRMGRLTTAQARTAVTRTEELIPQLDVIELTADLARHAGDLAERMALRGYDAVHLAAASSLREDDHVVVATDLALRSAATASGLTTANLR